MKINRFSKSIHKPWNKLKKSQHTNHLLELLRIYAINYTGAKEFSSYQETFTKLTEKKIFCVISSHIDESFVWNNLI